MFFFMGTWKKKSSWMYLPDSRGNLRMGSPLWGLDINKAKETTHCLSNVHQGKRGQLGDLESKKQPIVARSSVEAEYRAMALGICELMWIKTLLKELQVHIEEPMRLYCNNKATISIAHNPIQHNNTNHVEVDRHFIKEKIDNGLICTPLVSSKMQLANIFTKGVSNPSFNSVTCKLGMKNIFKPA
ncbi:Copia protein [Vitis vinifera]|uniref:Copia protein n=1 Tax=Vitis vinifera TaxID=29760 RepID=A0A438D2N2_VITVI|nr:Copia protein [Vitis vinifera]